ncbi:hypothetical protein DdX_09202 [Ditylenchus destructor]|uniref:Uncharacterized protein n=1 Tax=Ditylenchus destructor TaxID=166010 RepID=A0AAD4N449_9BILA|nr:hypothetical protein DdX_09202 [Ditylenchus destructor]
MVASAIMLDPCALKCPYEGTVIPVDSEWQLASGTCKNWNMYVQCRKACGDWNDAREKVYHELELEYCPQFSFSVISRPTIALVLSSIAFSLYFIGHNL